MRTKNPGSEIIRAGSLSKYRLPSAILMLALAFQLLLTVAQAQDEPCVWFHDALSSLPSRRFDTGSGEHVSVYDGRTYLGCEVRFETTDALLSGLGVPRLDAIEGSELYLLGWRMEDSIAADGPGTTVFAVRRESSICVVSELQPAYLNDNGELVQSDVLEILVQCHPQD